MSATIRCWVSALSRLLDSGAWHVPVYFIVTFSTTAHTEGPIFQQVVYVESIDLAGRGVVLPNDRVGMVVAQPYLSLTDVEPFRCSPAAKPGLLATLDATLAVARAASHGVAKTHFTIFPEYSIPGLEGVAKITNAMATADWPAGTVVIGGTDGLSRDEFVALAGEPNTHRNGPANDLARIIAGEWVNCGITWVKRGDGVVERWLQPKLHPAWPERAIQYQSMFQGQSVFTFTGQFENGSYYRFSTLVCFDWIATVANRKSWRWVVDALSQQAPAGSELPFSWFFVIQNNPSPSHDTFLTEIGAFFNQTVVPTVRRERACLLFANTAGLARPGRADRFGATSLVFTRQTLIQHPPCQPTFSTGGPRFRSSTLLNAYHDVLFRERGACIHSFAQINPDSLNAGPGGRTMAVERPFVYPMDGVVDPRTPAAPVPACVKWLNDELDVVPGLGSRYPEAALAGAAETAHQAVVGGLRALSAQSVAQAIQLATCQAQERNADEWDKLEAAALEHLMHALDILGVGYPTPAIGTEPSHAVVTVNGQPIDLLAIRGDTHEACIEHSKKFLPLPHRAVLLLSRDRDNTPWQRKFGSILEPEPARISEERNITDPQAGSLHLGYARLLEIFRGAATPAEVQGAINAELAA